MRPAPVLHVDDALSWRGGQQQVFYLHRGLLEHGVDSTVVCRPEGVLRQKLTMAGLPHQTLPLRGSWDLGSGWRLGRAALGRGALVHAHTSHAHSIALWGSRLVGRFPLVVSRRVDFAIGTGRASRWKYRTDRVALFLAISSGVEMVLVQGGVPATRIRRVPSGIDFARFVDVRPDPAWRRGLGVPHDAFLFGNVAALAPHKDHATLLAAFARYRSHGGAGHLVLLGEGELRGDLQQQVHSLGLDEVVHLPGFVENVLPCVATLDVFVLSSYLEGLGTSILDAMALGVPVVATAVGGVVDAVQSDRTGILVPPRDPEALARALSTIESDAAQRRRLAQAGREAVRSFDVRVTIERTLEAYRELA